MAFDVTNRETIRDEVATLLDTALTGAGNPAQAVYNHQRGDFNGQSPVVLVLSAGDDFQQQTIDTRINGNIYLEVWIYVLYADPGASWTEANAEDRLDLVKKETLDTIFDNAYNSTRCIYIDGRSFVARVEVGGDMYLWETIPLRVQVYDG